MAKYLIKGLAEDRMSGVTAVVRARTETAARTLFLETEKDAPIIVKVEQVDGKTPHEIG